MPELSFCPTQAPQRQRLQEVLRRSRNSAFYRSRLPQGGSITFEQWQQIPFTSKEDLRAAYPFGLLAVPKKQLATYHESTGSTGLPTASYFTENDWEDIATRFNRNAVGLNSDDTVLVKTPYSLVTTAHQMHRAARQRGALVVPADNRSSNMPYSRVVRLLKDLPVTVAWCLPTETLLWAAAARAHQFDPALHFPSLRAMLVAGEPLSEAKRSRIETVWGGLQVFQDYGSTETGSLAGECVFKKLHAWSDRIFFELFDEKTGKTELEGRGQLVVTPLYREGMPLVRYFLEDMVELRHQECPCGWGLPTLRILGRAATAVEIQGKKLFPSDLEDLVYQLPQEEGVLFWRAKHTNRSLQVEIEPIEYGNKRVGQLLEELIHNQSGIRAEVRTVEPGTLVSTHFLKRKTQFRKPRFLFGAGESWSKAIHY